MMTVDEDQDIKAAAREWVLRLSLEAPTPAQRAQFMAWCGEDPRHAAAYQRFQSIWKDAAMLQELAPLAVMEAKPPEGWRRAAVSMRARPSRWVAGAGLAAAMAGVGVWVAMAPVRYTTGVAQVREVRLSDGSDVTLGAASSLEVGFKAKERRVALLSGEAFFSVAKNAARPFVVIVGDKEVRVVGTKFEVRRDVGEMRVSVVEGTVEVMQVSAFTADATTVPAAPVARLRAEASRPATLTMTMTNGAPPVTSGNVTQRVASAGEEERVLSAGQQVTAQLAGPIQEAHAMPPSEPAAWRHGRLVYVDAPLREVVEDANRYSREPIRIGDEKVGDLMVSVTYPSDKIEEMLSALSRTLPVEIERHKGDGIVLRGK